MMAPELTILALAALLQGVQFAMYSVAANRQVGPRTAMGPRDTVPQLTGAAGRLGRALNNHFEGLILFTIAVVLVTLGNASGAVTVTCASVYLVARVLYVPAYLFGWVPGRSIIWAIGFGATMIMILVALFTGAAA